MPNKPTGFVFTWNQRKKFWPGSSFRFGGPCRHCGQCRGSVLQPVHLVAPDGADLLARLLLPGPVLVSSQAEEEEVPGAGLQLQQAGEHDREGVQPTAGGAKCAALHRPPTPPLLLTRALLGDHHKGCK